jgi:hypothetical protein
VESPALKGTAFQTVVEDLQRLIGAGQLARGAAEARLEAPDLELLDAKVNPAAWYPIASYARMVELLAAVEAPGQLEAYCVARGQRAAERLAALGLYSQLDATTKRLGARVGKLIVSVSGAIYNFGVWHFESGGVGRFVVRVEQAGALPEVSRFATQGFIQWVATRATGAASQVVSERPRPDQVLFRAAPAGAA